MMSFSQKEAEFVDKKRTTTNDNEELENDEELEFSNKYSEESKIDNSINLMNYGSKSEIKDVMFYFMGLLRQYFNFILKVILFI